MLFHKLWGKQLVFARSGRSLEDGKLVHQDVCITITLRGRKPQNATRQCLSHIPSIFVPTGKAGPIRYAVGQQSLAYPISLSDGPEYWTGYLCSYYHAGTDVAHVNIRRK